MNLQWGLTKSLIQAAGRLPCWFDGNQLRNVGIVGHDSNVGFVEREEWDRTNWGGKEAYTLGFQTPCEKVFGPQKHT